MSRTVTLRVSGFYCEGCLVAVGQVMRLIPGVEMISGDWRKGTVVVRLDDARSDVGAVTRALESLGYEAVPASEG